MFENWLKPIATSTKEYLGSQIGRKALSFEDVLVDNNQIDVLFVFASESAMNCAILEQFYELRWHFGDLRLLCGCAFRNSNINFVANAIRWFWGQNIFTVILGDDNFVFEALTLAYSLNKEESCSFYLSESFSDSNYFSTLKKYNASILHHCHIGHQGYFVSQSEIDFLEDRDYEVIRLGEARNAVSSLEPHIRYADFGVADMGVLKYADAPSQLSFSPNGFYSEEFCQIFRYAGLSEKLSSIAVKGYPAEVKEGVSLQLLAQSIWYLTEGYCARRNDFPVNDSHLMEYIVPIVGYTFNLSFWKSTLTSRWWIQVPDTISRRSLRHRLIPCSYDDYLAASKGNIPSRILTMLDKFDKDI